MNLWCLILVALPDKWNRGLKSRAGQYSSMYSLRRDEAEGGFMRKILILGFLLASAVWRVVAQNAEHAFDYDQKAPLDVQEKGMAKRGDA
jgi:hypothetical protein